MKQFYLQHRKSIAWQALQSGSILSLFVYAIFRMLFYEFPLSWTEEGLYFIKTFSGSLFLIATATGGAALLYRSLVKMKLYKRA